MDDGWIDRQTDKLTDNGWTDKKCAWMYKIYSLL